MSDAQAIADRVEIEALRGAVTDAVMTNDHDRLPSLFTPDGAARIPLAGIEAAGREALRAPDERVPAFVDYLVQTAHPGPISLEGDTASGRAYLSELVHKTKRARGKETWPQTSTRRRSLRALYGARPAGASARGRASARAVGDVPGCRAGAPPVGAGRCGASVVACPARGPGRRSRASVATALPAFW
jgi:SnoaL-like domain